MKTVRTENILCYVYNWSKESTVRETAVSYNWHTQEMHKDRGCTLKDSLSTEGGQEGHSRKGSMSKTWGKSVYPSNMVKLEHWEWNGEVKLKKQSQTKQGKSHAGSWILHSCNGKPLNKHRSYIVSNIF